MKNNTHCLKLIIPFLLFKGFQNKIEKEKYCHPLFDKNQTTYFINNTMLFYQFI